MTDTLEQEIKRLRSAAARALERVQVEDCGEAEMILSQVVNLDGSPVERSPFNAGADYRIAVDPEPGYKYVLDFGGSLHRVGAKSEPGPGGYPEGWRDLNDVLAAIGDPNAALLIRGLIEANEELRDSLRNLGKV